MGVVVISGVSKGIGFVTAKLFAQKGHTVYGLSRRGTGYEGAEHISCDITDEEAVKAAFAKIAEKEGHIDILINNAGYVTSGAIEFTDTKDAQRQFDVNFFGGFRCIKYALPAMKSGGKIINISSAAAIFPIPFQAFYSASKAAVNSLSFTLANELSPFGIQVCAVMPGDTKTDPIREKTGNGAEKYGELIRKSIEVMERDEQNGMEPEYVASCILKIARKKRLKPLYVAGPQYKFLACLMKFLPASFANDVIRLMYCPK
ncbi:MAG: 3-oxoacyl-(acyl-carrier-protein) reductase FabG1 [Firmicutes bacterium ADurb.Bin182]|nr:MAG: 3-oxoacyl-(acyl-carrier-protein) reductase FabG1 [Firmicutes bacterium ADurb.Bin182]